MRCPLDVRLATILKRRLAGRGAECGFSAFAACSATSNRKTLNELTEELTWFSLPAGEPLFHQGASGDALFVLVSGMLSVTVNDNQGEPRRIGYIHAGETVGELALMSGEPRSATVSALRDSTLFGLDQPAFQRLIDRHPHHVEPASSHARRTPGAHAWTGRHSVARPEPSR